MEIGRSRRAKCFGPAFAACPSLVLCVRALTRCEIAVQLREIFEYRDAGKRLNDGEHFLDLRLHIDERCVAAARRHLFAGDREHAQAGAADKLQLGQVEHHIVDGSGEARRQLPVKVRRSRRIEAAGEFKGDGARVLRAGAFWISMVRGIVGCCWWFVDGFNERLMESMRRETGPFLDHSHGGRLNDRRERLKPYDWDPAALAAGSNAQWEMTNE